MSWLPYGTALGALLVSIHSGLAGDFPNGFPTDTHFFPIGVWDQSPSRAARYKAIGINTFVGLDKGPTEEQLSQLASQNMFAVVAQNDVGLTTRHPDVIRAWMQEDEPDNAQPMLFGMAHVTCVPANEVARRSREMKERDPTRPVMINFGQGVANEFWRGRGLCNGDQAYYNTAGQGADILSFDIYPVGSRTPQVKDKLEYVAQGVSNLVNMANNGQSVWAVIESSALNPAHRPTPAQVRAEVWMALIHGAAGIVYFVHEFEPTFREDAIFRYSDMVEEITRTNRLIRSLAPALKSPNLSGKVLIESRVPIATMVKVYEGTIYLFAVAMRNTPSSVRVTIAGGHRTNVRVIDEDRTLAISRGVFEDDFKGYGVHLYQIPYEVGEGLQPRRIVSVSRP